MQDPEKAARVEMDMNALTDRLHNSGTTLRREDIVTFLPAAIGELTAASRALLRIYFHPTKPRNTGQIAEVKPMTLSHPISVGSRMKIIMFDLVTSMRRLASGKDQTMI